jgi:hypothetical protein
MATANVRRSRRTQPGRRSWPGGLRRLWAGAGALGVEGAAGWLHPAVGTGLAVADIAVPVTVALVLLTAILRGSEQTCERAFRLLRWITGQPEPPAPTAQ